MELITKSEFARRCGVTPQAIGKAVAAQKIDVVDGKIDFESASSQRYFDESGGHDFGGEQFSVPSVEQSIADKKAQIMLQKTFAQTRKLAAEARIAEMKERQMRGELWEGKFVDHAFVTLLQSAVNQFRSLRTIIPTIIASAQRDGADSLAESEQLFYDEVERIMHDVDAAWKKKIEEWAKPTTSLLDDDQ